MIYQIIIPARANSKRLIGKNMAMLNSKPLIQHSIDYAISNFPSEQIWVNSDDNEILNFAKKFNVNTYKRSNELSGDITPTVEVLKDILNYFDKNRIICDAIILLQPSNPLRSKDLMNKSIRLFENSKRNSLATFSLLDKKFGSINNDLYSPINYIPGERSQDLKRLYFENGLLYITKRKSIVNNLIITKDVYPLICDNYESKIDIDYKHDLIYAQSIINSKK